MKSKSPIKSLVVTIAIVAFVALISLFLQLLVGDFPIEFFAFPMNVVVAALWLLLLSELYRRRSSSPIAKYLLSQQATYIALALAAIGGVAVGVAHTEISRMWWFVAMLIFVMSHLVMITLRGWRNQQGVRWRFLLNHAGLLLALFAGFWGAADVEELRVPLVEGRPNSEAYVREGRAIPLGYEMELLDFESSYYDNGTPSDYVAEVRIDSRQATLRVNSPYRVRFGEDVYLVNYDKDLVGRTRCVVQIVRDRWQSALAVGIAMMLAGAMLMFLQGARKGVER